MLRMSDKPQGRHHCAYIPADLPMPDECVDYMAYTLVPCSWLVNFGPIEARQPLVRVSNGTMEWIEATLRVRPSDTPFLP
ncbi:hypothetical protein JVU11DRAFT_10394 [Chiua virens]|nr:hypothetical protein JVU11DRAFT_10394 [Chiua virens]